MPKIQPAPMNPVGSQRSVRELRLVRSGRLSWAERAAPEIIDAGDAIVRPFLAGRCDGDTLPIHRPVSRALQAGMALGLVDPVVKGICGKVPFRGPFPIGHECVAQVTAVGPYVTSLKVGQTVIVPWAVSCGACPPCRRGLTSKCATAGTATPGGVLAAFGFGSSAGAWGGMVTDLIRVPFADHLLVKLPDGVPPARVAAAGDNLADAWRAVVPPLAEREGGTVLVLGGGAKSIGLYAAGLAVAHGAARVDYFDVSPTRRRIAESFGARTPAGARPQGVYDVVVEATSRSGGLRTALRALAPGGICTAVGYYLATGTRLPLMHLYATDGTLRVGVSHVRANLPALLEFLQRTGFPAEHVTTLTADWNDAPVAYAARTTKLVLARDPLPFRDEATR
ncbi:alcohol dehydrogenase catalytic domain-containing protein [Actinoallomurus purpureus]|uniref:alcohol dehydrogenase catalytic domain-containing protein n=1 Tax=Actinoallomurus purpureus TaxID=478114 RepID=UPI002092E4F3|nr:alcohol dehydrogenase catalytic domain-containing protein [Actinoallomurus purpureus]MCO6005461.1 alcohol dehydrogenase catalytic domain-containing protein [Actinoallomurus purpureus]